MAAVVASPPSGAGRPGAISHYSPRRFPWSWQAVGVKRPRVDRYLLDGVDGTPYHPPLEQIKQTAPRFNTFYRPDPSRSVTVSQVARVAAKAAGLDPAVWTSKTVKAIAAAAWNRHIRYTSKGWEAYGIEGPEFQRRYSLDPLATVGSGSEYPVLWVPDPRNPVEPESLYQTTPTPPPSGAGIPGPRGEAGPPGPRGKVGPSGAGIPGPRGEAGIPGPRGAAGSSGAGIPGPRGEAGPPGPRGKVGPSGAGIPGPRGEAGIPGPRGETGLPGQATESAIRVAVERFLSENPTAAGERGPRGLPGIPGPRGETGASVPATAGGVKPSGSLASFAVLPLLGFLATVTR